MSDCSQDLYKRALDDVVKLSRENAALKERLAEAERDAARYRWLRERMEVRPQRAMSGSVRDALTVRIGCSFLDSEVSKRRSLNDPDAHESGCKKFDAAIDAFLSAASQPPPAITFPEDMSMAERIGDPRIDGQPTVAPCTCPSGGAWADLNQAHLPGCPRGNADNGEVAK